MAKGATLVVDVVVNAAKAGAEVDKAAGKFARFESGMSKLAAPAAVAGAAIVAFAASAAKSASRTQQAFGGLDAVFGDQSATVKGWANDAATSVGLSAAAYAEFAAQTGAQLKNMGVPMDEVAGQTDNLIKLGADLAATYGGSTADAVTALSAALRGEADPAERYGLALNQTAVNAAMAADGTDKLTGAAKTQAKAQTILKMATEQSGGAIGQFARESDSAAGSAQIAAAQWENAKSALGTALLPILSQVATQLAGMAGFVQQNATAFQILIGVVGGFAAAILAVNAAISVYRTIITVIPALQKAWAAAQWALNVAMSANPIGIIIIAIIALVAVIIIAYKKSETFRNIVNAAFNGVKIAIAAVIAFIQRLWAAIVQVSQAVATWFVNAWNNVKNVASIVINSIIAFLTAFVAVVVRVATVIVTPFLVAWTLIKLAGQLAFQVIRIVVEVFVAFVRVNIAIIKAIFTAAWNLIKTAALAAFNAIKTFMMPIIGVARTVTNAVRTVFTAAWNAIKAATTAAANWIKAKFAAIAAPIIAVVNRIKAAFAAAWNAIKAAASAAANGIKAAFSRIAGPIVAVAQRIKSGFTSALNGLRSIASGIANGIAGAFRSIAGAVNGAISAVRSLIGWLSRIHVPKISLPGGGGGTRSAVGVAYRGAPSVGYRMPGGFAGGASSGAVEPAVTINVNGALDPDAVARQIERILSGAGRRRRGVVLDRRAAGTAAVA